MYDQEPISGHGLKGSLAGSFKIQSTKSWSDLTLSNSIMLLVPTLDLSNNLTTQRQSKHEHKNSYVLKTS